MRSSLLLTLPLAVATTASAQVWDLATDFTVPTPPATATGIGPDGAWAYIDGSSGAPLDDPLPGGWITGGGPGWQESSSPPVPGCSVQTVDNPSGFDLLTGDFAIHGPENGAGPTDRPPMILEWTCPTDGTYSITGDAWRANPGNPDPFRDHYVSVIHNGGFTNSVTMSNAYVFVANDRNNRITWSFPSVNVKAGDTIELHVRGRAGHSTDFIGLNQNIQRVADAPDKWVFAHSYVETGASASGWGVDNAWSVLDSGDNTVLNVYDSCYFIGGMPNLPCNGAWVRDAVDTVPGLGRLLAPPAAVFTDLQMNDVAVHTANGINEVAIQWTAPAAMSASMSGPVWYGDPNPARNHAWRVVHVSTSGQVLQTLSSGTIDEFANPRATPALIDSSTANLAAGEGLQLRLVRSVGFVEGWVGVGDICVNEEDPVPAKWDLAANFTADTTSNVASGIGPEGVWSYIHSVTGNPLNAEVAGWITGGGPGWETTEAAGPVPGCNLQIGPPAGGLDLLLGDYAFHGPGNDPNPLIRHPNIVRWTAPRDMTVTMNGTVWNGNPGQFDPFRYQYSSLKLHNAAGDLIGDYSYDMVSNGQALIAGFPDEPPFNTINSRSNPVTFSTRLNMRTGDYIDLDVRAQVGHSPDISGATWIVCEEADPDPDKWDFVRAFTVDTVSGDSSGMGRDGAWDVLDTAGAPFTFVDDLSTNNWFFGSIPPAPGSPAWTVGDDSVPGFCKAIRFAHPSVDIGLSEIGMHTAGSDDPVAIRWCAPSGATVDFTATMWGQGAADREHDVTVVHLDTDGTTVLGTLVTDQIQDVHTSSNTLAISSTGTVVGAGEYIEVRVVRTPGDIEGFVFISDMCVTAAGAAPCPADWNGDTVVNTSDFIAYLNDYNLALNGNPPIFMDPDLAFPTGVINTSDFLAFLNLFVAGCP